MYALRTFQCGGVSEPFYDAILPAMYALSVSAEGDCCLCVPPDPGIEAAVLGASESVLRGTAPAEALHTGLSLSGTAALQDEMATTTTPGGRRVLICKCTRTGRHMATFTRRRRSSLYTLAMEPLQVAASAQVSASGPVAPPCSCRLLSHQTLLWHHRLGHPSLPRLRGMHSRLLVEGRQRVAPHSSSFPPKSAPLQTLHMDMWGPALVSGQDRERYFLLVVDDYTRYTTVFPLHRKGEDLPIMRLHSDRGGEFSDLLRDFCRGEDILKSFTLPPSPYQNGIAERNIGLVMEVARTSMIHAAAPHFMWPFAGSRAFVRDTSADKLSTGAIPCVFLGFPLDAHGWKFYEPTSRCVLPSHDVTFDESVPFYRPAPSGVSRVDPLLGTVPVEVAVDSGATRGAASGGARSRGTEPRGAEPWGAEPAGAKPRGAEPERAEPAGAESEGAESGGAKPRGTASSGGPTGASPRLFPRPEPLSPQQLREWFARCTRLRSGAAGAGDSAAGGIGAGGAGVLAGGAGPGGARTRAGGTGAVDPGAQDTGAARAGGVGGARARGVGAGGAGVGDPGAGGARAVEPGAAGVGAGGAASGGTDSFTEHHELETLPASRVRAVRIGSRVPCPHPPPVPGTHIMAIRPSSVPLRVPLPPPPESSLPAVPDPEPDLARAASPIVTRLLATVVTNPSCESTARSPLVAELVDFAAACRLDYATSLVAESESDCPPSVGGECVLGTDVLEDRQEDFECLRAAVPHLVAMLLALRETPMHQTSRPMLLRKGDYGANIVDGMWIFSVKRPPGSLPFFKAHYVERGFSQRQGDDFFHTFSPTPKMTTLRVLLHVAAQPDYELHFLDFSTAFLQGSLHKEIWLCRPPGFTVSFPAGTPWSLRWPVYGLRQAPREWHDTLRTTLAALGFAPSTADPRCFCALTLCIRRSTSSFPLALRLPLFLATLHSSAYRYTRTDLAYPLSILACYVVPGRHRPEHWEAAKRVLRYLCITLGMGLVLGGRVPVVLTRHADASWADDFATQQSSQEYTFSLGSVSVSWRSTRSSFVLSSSCEAEIYAGAMAAQELRWLTYLLTGLGERPCSSQVLYIDNKAMIALCQEHRLEHRTKHIALRYFLDRELQQHGQLRLAYATIWANTANIFTKALQSGGHQPCFAFIDCWDEVWRWEGKASLAFPRNGKCVDSERIGVQYLGAEALDMTVLSVSK
ncbi:unnamed protein product [Closterium sp. NIES-53]